MKKTLVVDIEVYPNYFLVMFRRVDNGFTRHYELYEGQTLDRNTLRTILRDYRTVSFNGNNFDIPVLMLALRGASNAELKAASDWIILGENRAWQFYDHYGIDRPDWIDHVDLIEVAPGDGSLKLYGGRLHSRKLQDLPIDPDSLISPEQRDQLRTYCSNDLETTIDLWNHLQPQIELRTTMSAVYGEDLRSKSDAQIAEAVIRKQVSKALGYRVQKPNIPPGTMFRYKAPVFLTFKTEQMRRKLSEIEQSAFVIAQNGSPIEPSALDGAVVRIGEGDYRMGIGGLHSSETSVAHYADENTVLMDADVASFYPFIILACGLYPKHLTEAFLKVYKGIVDTRIAAKKKGDNIVADSLKITINGSFGKLGSKYSALYAPDLMIQVTVTGQLSLLMLIESLELEGILVVSANTDGIVLKFARNRLEDVRAIIKDWETKTQFSMEETHYRAIFSRDVNNYIAIKEKGGVKGKGDYANVSISKNPSNAICNDAVKAFLESGVPVAETIIRCRDIRKFLTVQRVTGGAVQITRTSYDDALRPSQMKQALLDAGWHQTVDGPLTKARFAPMVGEPGHDVETAYRMHCGEDEFNYLGKVVRFYIGNGVTTALHRMLKNKNGNRNKVGESTGAVPLMELPDEFPPDVDYGFYIDKANRILNDIGALNG
jgi:hypothetical protein